ncbi:hypothetical protein IWQ61_008101 [Dispira simplex]|nr:hypothetical protein IWQ61_008101 [Dispira simplex]
MAVRSSQTETAAAHVDVYGASPSLADLSNQQFLSQFDVSNLQDNVEPNHQLGNESEEFHKLFATSSHHSDLGTLPPALVVSDIDPPPLLATPQMLMSPSMPFHTPFFTSESTTGAQMSLLDLLMSPALPMLDPVQVNSKPTTPFVAPLPSPAAPTSLLFSPVHHHAALLNTPLIRDNPSYYVPAITPHTPLLDMGDNFFDDPVIEVDSTDPNNTSCVDPSHLISPLVKSIHTPGSLPIHRPPSTPYPAVTVTSTSMNHVKDSCLPPPDFLSDQPLFAPLDEVGNGVNNGTQSSSTTENMSTRTASVTSGDEPLSPPPTKRPRFISSSHQGRPPIKFRDNPTPDAKRRFQCDYPGCTFSSARAYNLKTHRETHDPDKSRRFKCKSCEKVFSRRHDLTRHTTTIHEGQRRYVCRYCQRPYSRNDAMQRHTEKCSAQIPSSSTS